MPRKTTQQFDKGINERYKIDKGDASRLFKLQNARIHQRGSTMSVSRIKGAEGNPIFPTGNHTILDMTFFNDHVLIYWTEDTTETQVKILDVSNEFPNSSNIVATYTPVFSYYTTPAVHRAEITGVTRNNFHQFEVSVLEDATLTSTSTVNIYLKTSAGTYSKVKSVLMGEATDSKLATVEFQLDVGDNDDIRIEVDGASSGADVSATVEEYEDGYSKPQLIKDFSLGNIDLQKGELEKQGGYVYLTGVNKMISYISGSYYLNDTISEYPNILSVTVQ